MSNPFNTVISYPIPEYQNLPIEPQFYKPSQFEITAITRGQTTIVTMANSTNNVAPNYVIGQLVRFNIPPANGTRQLNQETGYVISIPSPSQVEVKIDSSYMNPFLTTATGTQPQIVAVGDINSGAINNLGPMMESTAILGSFQNISPL